MQGLLTRLQDIVALIEGEEARLWDQLDVTKRQYEARHLASRQAPPPALSIRGNAAVFGSSPMSIASTPSQHNWGGRASSERLQLILAHEIVSLLSLPVIESTMDQPARRL